MAQIEAQKFAGKRVAAYWAAGVLLAVGYGLLRGATWRGSADLHTHMETLATFLALMVGAMALVRFYSKKNNTFLFVGTAFLGTGFLDGYHALVTSHYVTAYLPSDLASLIPWSWVASRMFLGLLMYLSWLAWTREDRLGEAGRIGARSVYLIAGALTLASFLFFAFVPLPRAYYPEIWSHRPEEFVPALLFLLALVGYLRKGAWRHDAFEHWLVLSLVVGLVAQAAFMSHSGQLFDFEFDAAHALKMVSYLCVLTGLLISMSSLFRRADEGEARIRTIVDTVTDAIISIDEKGTIETFNQAAERMFGYRLEEAVGCNIRLLMPEPDRVRHDQYVRSYVTTGMAKTLGTGHEVRAQRKDGTLFPMELSVNEMRVGGRRVFVGSCRDKTEQKQIEEALRESEEKFRTVVDHSPTKIHIKDLEGRYLLVNREAEELFGVTEEQAKNKTSFDIFPQQQAEAYWAHDKAVLQAGHAIEEEEEWVREDGVHTYLTVKFPIRDASGKTVAVGAIGTDITERKRVEQALRASEARIVGILDIAPEAVISIDRGQRIRLFNKGAEAIFGYSVDEVLGRPLDLLLPSRLKGRHHAHMNNFAKSHGNIGRMREGMEITGLKKDGTEFSAKGSISKLEIGGETIFTTMLRDITEENLARREIASLAKFPDENPSPVLRVMGDGTVLYANQVARAVDSLLHGPNDSLCAPLAKAVREVAVSQVRREIEFASGGRTFAFVLNPVSGESYVNFYGRDVTERKRTEEALGANRQALLERVAELEDAQYRLEQQAADLVHLTGDLRVARDQSEAANRAKSEFLANMSHELRTPLNAIIGFSEVMKNETLGPVGSEKYLVYAEDIHDSGQHLLALINEILDLAKIESGTEELREESILIVEVVQSVLRLVRRRAETNGVEVVPDLADDLPSLYADRRKLTQILLNLLANAVKFTRSGGKVVLKVWCRVDSGIVFQIADTGIGIAPEDIPKALSKFGQVDGALDRQYEGSGLGLPLTKALVELHGGYLDLQSKVGLGTTVTVRFPAHRVVQIFDESPVCRCTG